MRTPDIFLTMNRQFQQEVLKSVGKLQRIQLDNLVPKTYTVVKGKLYK